MTGWVILEPGAAPALLAVGLGPALCRLLSALPSECLLPGQGKRSLLSPRGCTHAPGVQSRSARLCRLWACSESPQPCAPSSARRLPRTRRYPSSAARAAGAGSQEHHPGDGDRVIPATHRCPPARTAWLCPALQRGDVRPPLPACSPASAKWGELQAWVRSGSGAGRAPCGND